jgi:hypothetical protein
MSMLLISAVYLALALVAGGAFSGMLIGDWRTMRRGLQ